MSTLQFLGEFLRDPVTLGAVAPSGPALAKLMIDAAEIADHHVVAELGAGTGPMTAELVARHHGVKGLVVIEPVASLAATLRARFPGIAVEEKYAQDLPALLAAHGHERCDRVVSSLPWAIWPETLQTAVFDGVTTAMRPDARMVTFQYVHSQVLPAARRFLGVLERRFTTVRKTHVAWANVPPAFVYVCDGPR